MDLMHLAMMLCCVVILIGASRINRSHAPNVGTKTRIFAVISSLILFFLAMALNVHMCDRGGPWRQLGLMLIVGMPTLWRAQIKPVLWGVAVAAPVFAAALGLHYTVLVHDVFVGNPDNYPEARSVWHSPITGLYRL